MPSNIALSIISVDEARSVFGSSVSESTNCGSILPDASAYLRAKAARTTALGKTVVAARMVAERGVNVLILGRCRQLMDQWVERLGAFHVALGTIGKIGGGKRKPLGLMWPTIAA